jgi:hypothetical protein
MLKRCSDRESDFPGPTLYWKSVTFQLASKTGLSKKSLTWKSQSPEGPQLNPEENAKMVQRPGVGLSKSDINTS